MILRILIALFLSVAPACAGTTIPLTGAGRVFIGSGGGSSAALVFPGDIVSGAWAWWGLRAYNAAYATGSNNAINVRRASDNATQNIVILTSGALDITTANSFAGIDATCQGSTTGLSITIAFTSCSSTPKVSDTVSGSGITLPEFIVSCGSFVGGAGTCTLSKAQNIAAAETVTMQVALFITKLYDQSGNSNCTGHCDLVQTTTASQPQLIPGVVNGLPGVYCNAANSQFLTPSASVSSISLAQPLTTSAVFETIASSPGYNPNIVGTVNGTNFQEGGSGSANQYQIYAGTPVTGTMSDGSFHAFQVMWNGASSAVYLDGSATGSLNPGTNGGPTNGGDINICSANSGGVNFFLGYIQEVGLWSGAFSAGNQSSMNSNQHTYWGF
jgi:hypothetical protein